MPTKGGGWKPSGEQAQRLAEAMREGGERRKRRVGRPPKHVPLSELIARELARPGRPRRWDDDLLRMLLELADRWMAGERPKGERATDAACLRWLCRQHSKATGKRATDVLGSEFGRLRNALSLARRRSVSKP